MTETFSRHGVTKLKEPRMKMQFSGRAIPGGVLRLKPLLVSMVLIREALGRWLVVLCVVAAGWSGVARGGLAGDARRQGTWRSVRVPVLSLEPETGEVPGSGSGEWNLGSARLPAREGIASVSDVAGVQEWRPPRMLTLADAPAGEASGAANDAAELATKLSNPVSSLISVPFQFNADFNGGQSNHALRTTLNIQPVIPFALNNDWNLITRTIIPLLYQNQIAPGQGTNWGLGDINASFFFSPKQPIAGWIVGAGPVFLLPTATDTALGGGKWGAGPTAVLLQQKHGWTYGILANHLWSFAGDGDRAYVNSTFLQPFLSYSWPTATTLTLNTESTYDWRNRQWTVPINLGVSQVLKLGKQPISLQLGGRYYAEGPSGGPEWGVRFTITFLFPK